MSEKLKKCSGCDIKFNKKKSNYVCIRLKESKGTFKVQYFHDANCYLNFLKNKLKGS